MFSKVASGNIHAAVDHCIAAKPVRLLQSLNKIFHCAQHCAIDSGRLTNYSPSISMSFGWAHRILFLSSDRTAILLALPSDPALSVSIPARAAWQFASMLL